MKEYKYIISGKEYVVEVGERIDGVTQVAVNGETYNVAVAPEEATSTPPTTPLTVTMNTTEQHQMHDALCSPLPGTVIKVMCHVGDEVQEGDPLVVLEAMKMNNVLTAEHAGIVREVPIAAGMAVKENTTLVTFE